MKHTVDEAADYLIGVHADPGSVDAVAWDALLAAQSEPTPFMRHAYLAAMHASGSATEATGWLPQFITVHHREQLLCATVAWQKTHSYGEYVFDWAWADAYQRHGLAYYPKLLSAVPFTPVPGSRLLAVDDAARRLMLEALVALARQAGLSSVHLLFPSPEDAQVAREAGWLMRQGVQFHWQQRAEQPWTDFPDYLASLQREKRKKIQQERRKVGEAGVRFEVFEGRQITSDLWDYFHHCYTLTYAAHHSTPYLSRAFFEQMAAQMPEHWVMFVALRGDERVAVSLVGIDRERGTAWGRYWGCTEHIPCLHFEACYYQPLQWCITEGLSRFEGGAQGEHKMARGLLPVPTASAHWLAHPQFARAVEEFLQREGAGVEAWMDELRERNPFKPGPEASITGP
ncbi:GNAT family N-acetyltransferase [Ideonella margarita]|uniref:GNAT family N-acetyltransferase n=1 Tax=Ideonella margarita TaxID=2984191 RepID=A0ABU9C2D6_9BURK